MKKLIYLFVFSFLIVSCDSLSDAVELKVSNDLIENIDVNVIQTQGAPVAFDFFETLNLNSGELTQYKGKIKALKVNKLSYKFKNFSGNENGEIQIGTLMFDDIKIGRLTNINISKAASAGTVFEVTDVNVLSSIETAFLSDNTATIKLFGTVLSDAGTMDFVVEVFMNMTATVKD